MKADKNFWQNVALPPPPPPEWEIFQIKVVQKIFFIFQKSCRLWDNVRKYLWDNVRKYCRPGQAIDDNMAHAHCMLDT